MMTESRLNDLAAQCLADCYAWFPSWSAEPAERQIVHFALGIAGEQGEVVEIIKKWQGGRPGYDLEDPTVRAHLAEELCDVVMYVGDLAAFLGLDLDHALHLKRVANAERFGR